MKSKTSKFYLFMIFVITFIIIPSIVYAGKGKVVLTGIPALIVGSLIFIIYLFAVFAIPGYILYGVLIRPYFLKKKIKEYCQKNNLKFIDEAKKIPVEKKLYTSNVARETNYYMIEMGKKQDISYLLCHFYPRIGTSAGYRTICVMSKEGVVLPHFVLGENSPMKVDQFLLNSLVRVETKSFNDDKDFSNRFFVKSNDSEVVNYFNYNIRRIFKGIDNKNYYYEGNENVFVVSRSAPSTFEERINHLEFSFDLFNNLINNQ